MEEFRGENEYETDDGDDGGAEENKGPKLSPRASEGDEAEEALRSMILERETEENEGFE